MAAFKGAGSTANGVSADGRRLNNGTVYRVAGFTRAGDMKLETGAVLARDFGHVDYGYASTSHSAQGKTVDEVIIAMGRASTPASFYEQFYVTLSRGRSGVQLFTDDLAGVREAVTDSRARGSATELVDGALSASLQPTRDAQAVLARRVRWMKQEQSAHRVTSVTPVAIAAEKTTEREAGYAQNEQAR